MAFAAAIEGVACFCWLLALRASLSLIECRPEEPDTLDLVIDDVKNRYDIPKRGSNIKLSFGWSGEPLVDKGTFTVDEVEHSGSPDIITIRAKSASMTNTMHERGNKAGTA